MLIIAQELQTQSERLERDQLSLPCAFALGSMLLAALEGTASSDTSSAGSGDGGEELIAADVSGFKDVSQEYDTYFATALTVWRVMFVGS
jgi:hypothetical protein